MRQIILDTETTGLEPSDGHRIIEIGCIELQDRNFTGNDFHVYLNPQRTIDSNAIAVHGITTDFLADKPIFADIANEFLEYIKDSEIIAHNAPFDIGFLNHEFGLLPKKLIITQYASVIDTLELARKLHPGQRNSLDALCKRYKIDNTKRNLHGALLDARLLAEVYLSMTGGQTTLFIDEIENANTIETITNNKKTIPSKKRNLKIISANSAELEQHNAYLTKLKKTSGKCVWEENT